MNLVLLLSFLLGLASCVAGTTNADTRACPLNLTVDQVRMSPAAYEHRVVCVSGYLGGSFEFAGLFPTRQSALNQDLNSVIRVRGWGARISRGELRLGEVMTIKGAVEYPHECWASQTGDEVVECSPVKKPVYLESAAVVPRS